MKPTKEQFENIREERKQQILEAALEIFAQKGYHQASISQIASEANMSKGLLYNYFENKEQLLIKVMEDGIQYLLRAFAQPSKNNPADQLRKLIEESFNYMDEDQKHWRLYFSIIMQPQVQLIVMEKMMDMAMPAFENLTSIFSQLGFDEPFQEARIFGAMLDGLGINYLMDPESFPKEYCIRRLCEIYNIN